MADYLQKYAERFGLPVRLGIDVLGLTRNERGRLVVECAGGRIEADQVIVATGAHATQRRPSFAADLDPQIIQLHAGEYRNPSQLQEGGVLVVGAGNSGSEIANVVWCTGFWHDFNWIRLPVLDANGMRHERGVFASEPGLYFVGLPFLTSFALGACDRHELSS
jgi:cation diffusion facilitator CzcD-associated flavoprotein CzcO